jgi:DNA replication protein DnaC
MPTAPPNLLAQLQKRASGSSSSNNNENGNPASPSLLAAAMKKRASGGPPAPPPGASGGATKSKSARHKTSDVIFEYDADLKAFLFFNENDSLKDFVPKLVEDVHGNADTDISIPLAPCAYRMADYTFARKEPVALEKCLIKLGVLRCLQRECQTFNQLLWHRLSPAGAGDALSMPCLDDINTKLCPVGTLEEDELGKVRFMELLSNCGIYQLVSELILQRVGKVADVATQNSGPNSHGNYNPWLIPQVRVEGLDEYLDKIEELTPTLKQAREEIEKDQTVSFFPGLGEFFTPGSKLLCHPEGMEGSPLGCSCVQSWYAEELNQATGKIKRRFILVMEFVVSVGDELVFVACTDVYPEFHDTSRNMPVKDLTHRKLLDDNHEDMILLDRLQRRGEFYASVATKNHYLEYYSDSFFPIIGGGWSSNAVRPLSKGGRVMVDVKRGIMENHYPTRSSDGYSDTVKEAIKLFEQNKRTGIAVPFRTAVLPEFEDKVSTMTGRRDSDKPLLWQSWPMVTGFSFTARVWGKLLLGLPKPKVTSSTKAPEPDHLSSPRRSAARKMGVQRAALGGEGSSGNCGYISFQEQAFEQLVLDEDKKELIRAVARNAGGGPKFDQMSALSEDYDDDDDDYNAVQDAGIDVVANKGGASIFLLHGPPGCGKTLTAEAIAELLKKPLYIITAGDLGVTAADVEKMLGSVLDLCSTWDALVLIDEADLFLETRTSTEIQRNALVCVMLRLLEYYSGCLFLSSNRAASSIDPAIASRITVMLGYPPLGVDGRAKVWKNLVELVPPKPKHPSTGEILDHVAKNPQLASKYREDFSDADYVSLASAYELNGRQIKNSIVLARALAQERGTPLSIAVLCRAVTAVAGEGAAVSSS